MTTNETTPTYVKRRYLSVSTLISFARCPRRYFYSKCGLQSHDEMLAPLYGSAMHAAVPVALETSDVTKSMAAFMSVWDEVESRLDASGDSDPKRNRTTAERSLKHFIHTHQGQRSLYTLTPPPAGALVTNDKTSSYEVPWAIDIGLPIPLVGRFDSFCVHRDTGEPWILELKTTSQLNARFFDAHEMSPQNATYCLVGQTLTGQNVAGIMIEGMLVDAKKVENITQPVPIQQHHLEDILRWLRATGHSLLKCEQAAEEQLLGSDTGEHFLKDFTGCTPYPFFYTPGYRCEYADLCRVRDWRLLTSLYQIKPDHDFLRSEDVRIDPSVTVKVSTTTTTTTKV